MRGHHREVLDFLREYGAREPRICHKGTKHPRVMFTFRGREHSFPIAGSPSDTYRATKNMIGQLKTELGEPDAPAEPRQPRRLEAMLPGPKPAPEPAAKDAFMGWMAHYTKGSLRFFPPEEIYKHFSGSAVLVTRPGRADWELRRTGGETPQVRPDGSKFRLEATYAGEALPLFGNHTPAEYLIVDDVVLVRLLVDQLVEVKPMTARRKMAATTEVVHAKEEPVTRGIPAGAVEQAAQDPPQPTTDEWIPSMNMYETLRHVDYYERTSSFRMAHKVASGRAFWKPPAAIEIED